jgi:DNA-binding CsgD family transcriptional regulator
MLSKKKFMARYSYLILILLLMDTATALAQVSFQISNYSINEALAGNQNWDIATDESQRIFVANNSGLLLLENTNLRVFDLSEPTIFRSVAFINDTIYTGSFENFGYWKPTENGNMHYQTLISRLDSPEMNNDEIWKIVEHEGKVYFHSFGSIYAYNPKTEETYRVPVPGSLMFLFQVGGQVYTQEIQGELYRLQDDTFVPIPNSHFFSDEEVKSIIGLTDETLLIATSKGIYTYDGSDFSPWQGENKTEVVHDNINTMVKTSDKIIIGTILNGLYVYDHDFNLLKNINTENRLQNNTILSLAVDPYDNVWVGMDNGLDYIAFDTPINTYRNEFDDIGSVYAGALFKNELYIGTNQGIYWFKRDDNGNFYDRTLITDSQGQVWFIKEYDGFLYAGLNDGTYLLRNKSLHKISDIHGGYNLKSYPKNSQDVLLQSTYSDLVVYEKVEKTWKYDYTLTGFQTPARFLEFDHLGNIWLGHTVKGIFQLQPNMQFSNIEQVKNIGPQEGLSQNTNRVFKLNNRIMTSFKDTLLQWDPIDEQFIPFNDLNPFFTEKGTVRNILPAGDQRYWVIKDSEINLFEIHFNSTRLIYRLLPKMNNFQLVDGYENIITLNTNLHLICLDDGFAILNLDLLNRASEVESSVRIQSVKAMNSQNSSPEIEALEDPEENLPFRNNTINIQWTTTQLVGNRTFFQYKLAGIDDSWSDWTTKIQTSYQRLPSGEYTFAVRSINNSGLLTEAASFSFTISQPWYFSTGAYILYFILIASFGFMIRLYISRKRWKKLGEDMEQKHKNMQRERENAEKEIIKLTNEKLQSEVEHKSSQLASNTMAMMRKKNLLNSIQDELQNQKNKLGNQLPDSYFKEMTKLIEDGIEDEHEWEIFEQLYNEAHGNFFKRLKETYPQLTPSDLRLCAYLRMNLSSKEVAPLLNISVRGVEERRYRLRKRLDLSTDTNLTELIMTF